MSRLKKNMRYLSQAGFTEKKVLADLKAGLSLLKSTNNRIVTIFGSHKVKKGSYYYRHCRKLAYSLGMKGYAIFTGGGPGIMHAANTGASDANAQSVGLKAEFIQGESVSDDVFTKVLSFHFMFVRRFILSIKSEALIFYPGGYGTLNELFEYLVLMQTGAVDKVPIICVDKKYWRGLFDWLKTNPLKNNFYNNAKRDLKLLHFAEDLDEILTIIEKK